MKSGPVTITAISNFYLNGEEIIDEVASIKKIIYTLHKQKDKIPRK